MVDRATVAHLRGYNPQILTIKSAAIILVRYTNIMGNWKKCRSTPLCRIWARKIQI